MADPYYEDGHTTLYLGDCLDVMAALPDGGVDLILTDPPYFRVKNLPWDRQWDDAAGFLSWIARLSKEWSRILAPNGSIYCFASARMAAQVERVLAADFVILNSIAWAKPIHTTRAPSVSKESLRSYFPASERVIFAEQYGADSFAMGNAGYRQKCEELRGWVFEPIRAYLAAEWKRAGLTRQDANDATGTFMAGHWLSQSQWQLPTREHYEALRRYAAEHSKGEHILSRGHAVLTRDHDVLAREYDVLAREYDELKKEYEALRRPFTVSVEVPYTDVWTYPTVSRRTGKHPCEKPYDMMADIVRASSAEGAVVLDCFAGSGVVIKAARDLNRHAIGVELDPTWCARIAQDLDTEVAR